MVFCVLYYPRHIKISRPRLQGSRSAGNESGTPRIQTRCGLNSTSLSHICAAKCQSLPFAMFGIKFARTREQKGKAILSVAACPFMCSTQSNSLFLCVRPAHIVCCACACRPGGKRKVEKGREKLRRAERKRRSDALSLRDCLVAHTPFFARPFSIYCVFV